MATIAREPDLTAPADPPAGTPEEAPAAGRYRVLVTSTLAFTLMFAVWLQLGILGLPIKAEFGLSDTAFYWLTALPVLNGAIWRMGTGVLADRWGGRVVMAGMLLLAAVPTFLLAGVHDATLLFVLAFLIGFAGNSFSSGIAWNSAWFPRSQQGFALGVFGAGNVGASVTKLIGPALIAATAGATYLGVISGGWRIVPVIYGVALVVMAVVLWFVAPRHDRRPGATTPMREHLRPLRRLRVWRFSLYYVAVFGAYVALSSALPFYYEKNYDVPLWQAGLLTALFIFPASLLRPLGGWMSDKVGARRIMYWTFGLMLVSSGILMMPSGYITVEVATSTSADGTAEILPWHLGIGWFTALVVLLGCAMGIGKAAVYKHIPEYFPHEVGAVGGVVGMLGALGGFFLLPIFGYAVALTGIPSAVFGVLFLLTLVCVVWMHLTVVSMLHRSSPQLADDFELPHVDDTVPSQA
ncbi:MAG: nitrate/nitrite transporter [Candidatus Nanopelagicales bacterium]